MAKQNQAKCRISTNNEQYIDKYLHINYTTERTVDKVIGSMQASTAAKKRVFDRAEQLFTARGYTGVSMRDIADSLAMRQASLYYHVPEGKEQLYVEVAARNLRRHQAGISEALGAKNGKNLDVRLLALADWFLDHMPLRLLSMLETDMASLSPEHAQFLTKMAHQALFEPIATVFAEAQEQGEIRDIDPAQLAAYFLSLIDGISYSSTSGLVDKDTDLLVGDALNVLLNGLYSRGLPTCAADTKR
jgi:AcrR family transcriptional regulator